MKELVLLDDDSMVAVRLERMLRRTDWTLKYFTAEEPFLDYLAQNVSAALLVDEYLPRNEGHKVLSNLVERVDTGSTPVYLISSVELTPEVSGKVRELGFGFAVKDILCDRDALLSLLEGKAA